MLHHYFPHLGKVLTSARVTFSGNFLECGGFGEEDLPSPRDIECSFAFRLNIFVDVLNA